MQGRVKFHRKITEREWYSDANTFRVFFHLITIANHKDWKRQGIDVKRWQTITSIDSLAEQIWLTSQKVRTAMDKLISTWEIAKKTTNRNTIVTVLKYCDYNDYDWEDNKQITSQITNKQQTDNKQITTNKNDKNKKEWKEVIVSERDLRDWVDNWASNRFNSDTKINPTVLRTIISMMDIWFIVDKTEKRLQEIKLKLCDKMRLYYTLWDGTLQLIRFEDEVWKRKEHWRDNPPRNHLNSLWNRLIPYEVRNPKK